ELQAATQRVDDLESQRQAALEKAHTMRENLDRAVGYFYRVQATGSGLKMIVQGNDRDDFLYRLSTLSRLTETTSSQYEAAAAQENLVAALTVQAKEAREARDRLADAAQDAADKAKAAAHRAEVEVDQQREHSEVLYAQLAYLKDTTAKVEKKYH